jgi:glutamine amidotransferase
MNIFIVDAGIGNVGSVMSMLKRIGQNAALVNEPCQITPDTRIILPGVGTFDAGMRALIERGLDRWIRDAANSGTPIIGICLGMQLLFDQSEEGIYPGLSLLPGKVVRLPGTNMRYRIPHMGWNIVRPTRENPILPNTAQEQRFYFVHSYCVQCRDQSNSLAITEYGSTFTSIVGRGNIFGVQFHPEKSHRFGLALLERFATARLEAELGNAQC